MHYKMPRSILVGFQNGKAGFAFIVMAQDELELFGDRFVSGAATRHTEYNKNCRLRSSIANRAILCHPKDVPKTTVLVLVSLTQ